jgi:peptidoglycan-associated lipoprotein
MIRTVCSYACALLVVACALVLGCGSKSNKPGSCKSDKDCKNGQHCSENKCVQCLTDAQCAKGEKCSANACVKAAQCTKDSDCSPGQVCQAGKCKACSSDGDCGPGGSCQAGACQRAKACTKDEDCADDEDCVAGFCKKAGGVTNPTDVSCQLSTIYFAFDDATIQSSERERLEGNAQCIDKNKGRQIYVVGHTDTSGTEEYNIALSERRARSVADFMARLGTDPARLQVVPKGETEPTGMGDDKDRRCEFQWR